jgi:UPF0042 nucleotide-binding protein
MASKRPEVLLLVGMSGAGRSSSSNVFEDLGYYVIENLPADLVESVVNSNDVTETNKQLVLTIDAKDTSAQSELKQSIDKLNQSGVLTRIIFLDADNETLLERYEENRRPHPMGKDSISQSVKAERELLKPIREISDQVIDTTDMNVHELRKRIIEGFQGDTSSQDLKISVTSFGFKNGTPRDADIVFDVRFLPNPHWREELRASTGQSPMVRNYVLSFEDAQVFLNKVKDMVEFLLPRFISEGKSYVGIAIGCTGGKHRSVVMAEEVTKWLKGENNDAVVLHRDMKEI